MLKYVSKFVLEIFPSVVATIVGAYIVNYYIVPKAVADKPAAALASTADSKAVDKDSLTRDLSASKGSSAKADGDALSDTAVDPVAAKASVKPATDKSATDKTNAEKAAADKAPDTAATSVRRHQPAPREKVVTEKAAIKPQPVPATTPVATASATPLVDAPTPAEERRDANDLARAAIERLRVTSEPTSRPDASRAETTRVTDAPRVVSVPAPAIQPLPPAIMVSTPRAETFNPGLSSSAPAAKPPYQPADRADDARRPRPPGEIPSASQPMDLRADATGSASQAGAHDRTTVADDMLSAAKSVFHAVLPK